MSRAEVIPLAIGTRLTLRAGTCLVLDGSERTLVDPGALAGPGELEAALAALGLGLADVTRVFYTHLHFDHYAGTAFGDQVDEVVMPREEYLFLRDLAAYRHDRAAYEGRLRATHERIAPVFMREFLRLAEDPRNDLDRPELRERLRLAEPGEAVGRGLRTVALAGHCPGQLGLAGVTQHGETLVAGDAVLSLEDFLAPDLEHLLIIWDRARLLAARERVAMADCVIPGHGPWFRPAARTLIATEAP